MNAPRPMTDAEVAALERAIGRIAEVARDFGLDTFPMRFEICPAEVIYTFGAYGMPIRYSHWSFGKSFHRLKTQYDFGLSKIYELVINSDPCYAFLLDTNGLVQNMLVAAHVYGHCDFFKRNRYFGDTNRRMVESMAAAAERVRRYEFDYGLEVVERFLDACLSIQEHSGVSLTSLGERAAEDGGRPGSGAAAEVDERDPYADLWALDVRVGAARGSPAAAPRRASDRSASAAARAATAREAADLAAAGDRGGAGARRRDREGEPDLLGFIARHARGLAPWQLDIIGLVRDEARYFRPQMETKIVNEGWASFWHAQIMRRLDLDPRESVEFARMHASVLQPARHHLNPYHLGYEIWCDIEKRHGREAMFELRECERDTSFVRNHLTEELVEKLDLFLYEKQGDAWRVTEKGWRKVRDGIVASLTNCGIPTIHAEDDDYRGRGELYLRHVHEGIDLDREYAEKTLEHVYYLWGRPVHLETKEQDGKLLLSFDGKEHKEG